MNIPHSPRQPISRFHGIILLLLIVLASMLRIYGIDRESLWTDELFAVMASYLPSFREVWPLLINDSHPPGYVSFMYWTLPLTGYTDFGVRLHALLCGIVWIPLVYWLGKRLYSMHVGIVAAAIVTCSYSAIYFSQEARAYSMLVAFNLLNIVCFMEILFSKQVERRFVIGFIVSSIIMYYLHYTGFVFIAAEGLLYLILYFTGWRRGTWRELLVIFGIPLFVYSPWLWFMFDHVSDQSKNWAVSAKPTPMDVFYIFRYLWGPDHNQTLLFIYSMPLALAIGMRECLQKKTDGRITATCVLLFLMIVPVLAFYIESVFWTPIFEKRYFLVTVPMVALLSAMVLVKAIETLTAPVWHKPLIVFAIMLITVAMISKNIERKLYTAENKDPIRQAVDMIKADLGDKISSNDYTTLVTHNAFEHYLKQTGIHYDAAWPYRRFYVPQHIGEIDHYLKSHTHIRYFYYIAARETISDRARNALKIKYKRLSKIEMPFNGGAIDILKYDARAPAAEEQLEEVRNSEKSPLNDSIKIVSNDVGNKPEASYVLLMTHDWMEDRIPLFNLKFDENFTGRRYQTDIQIAGIVDYVKSHPDIDTIYYFYLKEPHTRSVPLILQSQYALQQEWVTTVTSGELHIFKLSARTKPKTMQDIRQQLQGIPLSEAAALVGKLANISSKGSSITLVSHASFKPFLEVHGIQASEAVNGGFLSIAQQTSAISDYLKTHPAVRQIHYLALIGPDTEPAIATLQQKVAATCRTNIDASPLGQLAIMAFRTDVKIPDAGTPLPTCDK